MTSHVVAEQALDAIRKAQSAPDRSLAAFGLEKSTFAQSSAATSGLTFYDLEVGAKLLYPLVTPLRNSIPRVSGRGGIQANWRAITSVNGPSVRIGVSPGNRGAAMPITTKDYSASYKSIGGEMNVDFEAAYAANGFDDLRAIAAQSGLHAVMIGEEAAILGGNSSFSLGVTPTPAALAVTAGGGQLAAQSLSVICVALSFDGFLNASIAGGIQANVTRTNADGSTDNFGGGAAQKSANIIGSVTAGGSAATTVKAVPGAMGYAWFWGAAGSEVLGALTTINSVNITANATGTQTAASLPMSDFSTNSLIFDGLLTMAANPSLGGYTLTQPTGAAGVGAPLTADGAGGIVEIDQVLKILWDTLRLSPQTMWVNSQEALNISRKIQSTSASSAQRFVFQNPDDAFGGSVIVRTYLNRFSMAGGQSVNINVHPNMPPGTILFDTATLPYPLSNVVNVRQIRTRQDYYQIEWPLKSRRYEYGVYSDQVLQHYFPPSLALITNIGNG